MNSACITKHSSMIKRYGYGYNHTHTHTHTHTNTHDSFTLHYNNSKHASIFIGHANSSGPACLKDQWEDETNIQQQLRARQHPCARAPVRPRPALCLLERLNFRCIRNRQHVKTFRPRNFGGCRLWEVTHLHAPEQARWKKRN